MRHPCGLCRAERDDNGLSAVRMSTAFVRKIFAISNSHSSETVMPTDTTFRTTRWVLRPREMADLECITTFTELDFPSRVHFDISIHQGCSHGY